MYAKILLVLNLSVTAKYIRFTNKHQKAKRGFEQWCKYNNSESFSQSQSTANFESFSNQELSPQFSQPKEMIHISQPRFFDEIRALEEF
jgi:hypothetical protein